MAIHLGIIHGLRLFADCRHLKPRQRQQTVLSAENLGPHSWANKLSFKSWLPLSTISVEHVYTGHSLSTNLPPYQSYELGGARCCFHRSQRRGAKSIYRHAWIKLGILSLFRRTRELAKAEIPKREKPEQSPPSSKNCCQPRSWQPALIFMRSREEAAVRVVV